MESNLMSKKALSAKVGWSEANGRRWVKNFKDYIPCIVEKNKVFYTEESYKILTLIKRMSENGLTSSEILEIFKVNGLPESDSELKQTLDKYTSKSISGYIKNIADTVPSQKQLVLPVLSILSDR